MNLISRGLIIKTHEVKIKFDVEEIQTRFAESDQYVTSDYTKMWGPILGKDLILGEYILIITPSLGLQVVNLKTIEGVAPFFHGWTDSVCLGEYRGLIGDCVLSLDVFSLMEAFHSFITSTDDSSGRGNLRDWMEGQVALHKKYKGDLDKMRQVGFERSQVISFF